jgi:hypothetical protein
VSPSASLLKDVHGSTVVCLRAPTVAAQFGVSHTVVCALADIEIKQCNDAQSVYSFLMKTTAPDSIWNPIATAPAHVELELRVREGEEYHSLTLPADATVWAGLMRVSIR